MFVYAKLLSACKILITFVITFRLTLLHYMFSLLVRQLISLLVRQLISLLDYDEF